MATKPLKVKRPRGRPASADKSLTARKEYYIGSRATVPVFNRHLIPKAYDLAIDTLTAGIDFDNGFKEVPGCGKRSVRKEPGRWVVTYRLEKIKGVDFTARAVDTKAQINIEREFVITKSLKVAPAPISYIELPDVYLRWMNELDSKFPIEQDPLKDDVVVAGRRRTYKYFYYENRIVYTYHFSTLPDDSERTWGPHRAVLESIPGIPRKASHYGEWELSRRAHYLETQTRRPSKAKPAKRVVRLTKPNLTF